MIYLISLLGAVISRFHGGGFISGVSKSLKNAIWAIPFGITTGVVLGQQVVPLATLIVLIVVSIILCIAGKALGHGRVWNPYLPLDTTVSPERVEHLITFLKGRIPDFWYKTIAMGLVGFAAVSGASIVISTVDPLLGILIGLGGFIGKPLSYLVGWKLPFVKHGNEIGEYGTGLFAYFMLGLALVKVI